MLFAKVAVRSAFMLGFLQCATVAAVANEPGASPQPLELGDAESSAWVPSCYSEARSAPLSCSLVQRLIVQETGQTFLTITVEVPSAGDPSVMRIQTPLGVYLPNGLKLRVDDAEPLTLAYGNCDTNGCYVRTASASPVLTSLESGKVLHLVLHTDEENSIALEIPLTGFSRAYTAIR
jgi:invasion protein IalB